MLPVAQMALESAAHIQAAWSTRPLIGIVLGSGLGNLANVIESPACVDFKDLPGFPRATAIGHRGRFIGGSFNGVPVIVQQGRLHAYEGHPPEVLGLPVRTMHALGVRTLILTNAAGSVNESYAVGDVMLLDDHINLMFANPLIGPNDESLGPRFVDLAQPYDPILLAAAERCGQELGLRLHRGVYAAVLGPNYETRAEYQMLRTLGADCVGMSTIPETLVARHAGMRVFALSLIANSASLGNCQPTTADAVLAAVLSVESRVRQIIAAVIEAT